MGISAFHVVRRRIYWGLVFLVPLLGLGVRAKASLLPTIFVAFAPDGLWAFLVFALVAALFSRLPTFKVAVFALGFACSMELSQLYQAPWINELRANRIGGLLLGFGFLWSDLVCYIAGVALGVALDLMLPGILLRLNKRWNNDHDSHNSLPRAG